MLNEQTIVKWDKNTETDLRSGLTKAQVKERQTIYGPNRLKEGKKKSVPKLFWEQLNDPLIYILMAAIAISLFLGEAGESMIIAAVIGILGTNPTINLPAFTGWTNSFNGQVMFPYLFITVACGAISGFHSLIASGTTSKQLNNEGDAKLIGYGSMLIECVLAVIALIAVGALFSNGKMPQGTPAVVFASAISGFFSKLGMGQVAVNTTFTVISLAISAFALTSLDTATRLGRFLFQELFTSNKAKENSKVQGYLGNMYVGTFITVGLGAVLCLGGYQNIWPLFGACNQLVAVPCFLGVSVWLAKKGKKNFMLLIPMFFMLAATMSSLLISFKTNLVLLLNGKGSLAVQGLQVVVSLPIFVLALILVVEGMKVLWEHRKKKMGVANSVNN